MARGSSSNPLAHALDKRIRAVVEESMDGALRDAIRGIVREELAKAIGSRGAPAAPAAIGTRRPGRAGRVAGRRGAGRKAAAGERVCEVAGCKRPYRSQGYCAAHYQSARKYGWPLPAPKNFQPPPRPPRGRPPKAASAD